MEIWQSLIPVLLLAVFGWHSNIANSAVIVEQNGDLKVPILSRHQHYNKYQQNSNHTNINNLNATVRQFQEALTNYAELTNAYYSPAPSETVREKRTLRVIQGIVNATRTGFSTVRSLFSGVFGGGSSGGGFRGFFSNLINRILVFLTNLWDRITGFFRGEGFGGSSGGGGGLFSSIFSIFRPPTTTTESYFDSDFSYYSSSTEAPEKENEVAEAVGVAGDSGSSSNISENKEKAEGKYDLIPFPGDSDVNSRSGKSIDAASSPVSLAVKTGSDSPHVVSSPSIIHLLDDGRRF